MQAVVGGVVIADSDDTVVVEGNHYFPMSAVRTELLEDSASRSLCPWKGVARYATVVVGDQRIVDGGWTYPRPWPLARRVGGRMAFWQGVEVRRVRPREGR